MKKEDFKLVRGIAMISNMTFAVYILMIIFLGIFIFWDSGTMALTVTASFGVLWLISSVFNVMGAKKLDQLELKGTAKDIAKLALNHSYWFIFPFLFSITMNRLRGGMWDYVIKSRTAHISDPYEKMVEESKLLEELYKDGFVSKYTYENQREKAAVALPAAKLLSEKIKEQEKNPQPESEEDDEWI